MVQEVESWILVRTIFNKLNRLAEEDLKALEVTSSQFTILSLLACHKSLTMSEISNRLSCVNSNITSVIGRMLEKELVIKEVDKLDRRIVKVTLTDKGYDMFQSIAPRHHDFFCKIYNCLEEKEFAVLNDLLGKLNKGLSSKYDGRDEECII